MSTWLYLTIWWTSLEAMTGLGADWVWGACYGWTPFPPSAIWPAPLWLDATPLQPSAIWPAPRFTILFLPRVRSLLQGQSSSSPALSQLYSENWPEDGRLIFPYISARCLEPNECCVAGHFHPSLGDLEPEQTSIVARGLSAQTAIFVKSISKPDNWPKFSSWQTSFATIIHTVPDMLCFRQDCSKAGGGNFGWQYMVMMSRMTLVVKDRSHWKNQQVLVLLYKSHSSVVHY